MPADLPADQRVNEQFARTLPPLYDYSLTEKLKVAAIGGSDVAAFSLRIAISGTELTRYVWTQSTDSSAGRHSFGWMARM